MLLRRSRIVAALLALMVAFHWLPGALAASTFPAGVICGSQYSSAPDGISQPGGGGQHCKFECKLCAGTGVSAPAVVPVAAPSAAMARLVAPPRSPDLASTSWAPVWARPPPRG